MPRCGNIARLLGAYRDGELDGKQSERVRRHLEQCAPCRENLARIRRLAEVCEMRRRQPAVSVGEWETRWSAIREHVPAAPRRPAPAASVFRWGWARPAWVTAGVAAALCVIALVVALGLQPWARTAQAAEPGCIVTLVESNIDNGSVMYYHSEAKDVSMITLIVDPEHEGGA